MKIEYEKKATNSDNLKKKNFQKRFHNVQNAFQMSQLKGSKEEQPVEYRNLYKDGQSMAQGSVEMLLDIMTPAESNLKTPLNIKPPEPQFYEIR